MLVLTREIDERIVVCTPSGERIEIVNCGVLVGGRTRIGVNAPRNYTVLREELQGRRPRNNRNGHYNSRGGAR